MKYSIKVFEQPHPGAWNEAVIGLPGFSILQSAEWGQVKQTFGWQQTRYIWEDESGDVAAAAQVLLRKIRVPLLPIHLKTMYVPQGPVADWSNLELRMQVLKDLRRIAEESDAVYIKIDPEIIYSFVENEHSADGMFIAAEHAKTDLISNGWRFSPQQIQFKNTAWLSLTKDEDTLLAEMKQKTRYNIRLAGRKGVTVKQGAEDDIELLYKMYLETSLRDGFIIRPLDYYRETWSTFIRAGLAVPLIAYVGDEPVAGLVLFILGNRSWYLFGMSTDKHREKMPNYLLQWEAIKISKERNCAIYDLWGAPDVFDDSDNLWGIYRFKSGLGAHPVQRLGAYDLPLKKNSYKIIMNFVPKVLNITRRIRKAQQLQELN